MNRFAHPARPVNSDARHTPTHDVPFRRAPHNLDAEQALLGGILVNNAAIARVEAILRAADFYDPLHQQIYETILGVIASGQQATPITLRTFFENAEPIDAALTVPHYLGRLAANACTIINVPDYADTIRQLAVRRQLIVISETVIDAAYDSPVDFAPNQQIDEAVARLSSVRDACHDAPSFAARCLADVPAVPIQWLWPNRLALGKLSLIAGQPGLGKSQLTLAMIAAVTTGGRWPDGAIAPSGSAVLVSCEDDAADTIRPRLEAAGADVSRVHLFDWAMGRDRTGALARRHFDVAAHVPALAELIVRLGDVRLIVIDPITAYMGGADSYKTADVRTALVPLQAVAGETGAAVILVTHLNKNSADSAAMNRVVGSGAYVAVCRSAWLVAADPQDDKKHRRVLAPLKNNIGDDRTGFAFATETMQVAGGITTSRIVFEADPIYPDADDLLRSPATNAGGGSAINEACAFLRTELASGAQPTREVERAAGTAGISTRTLDNARKRLGIVSSRAEGRWWLQLPEDRE